ncbi:phospholipase D family protein [Roseomonas nepalensis]|uniref:Phospholipase D n=1 Tax=Muricoccus nepalensis TaxID=1854500 RepID=A0A502GKQ2_9PROT|nr:phospholipase D family protein [Roseomonas nepalensis]
MAVGGLAAFAARVRAARGATRTLDLQYYIWRDDLSGRLLAREVLRVAGRGVRVRLLLDDMYAIGRERYLSAFDAHPFIEVRLFNATRWRRFGKAGLLLEMLFGGWHLNRRMHNKAWIADGQVAICGGRNVGDEYFDASGDFNFRDLDLAVAGPEARAARAVFDRYWQHPLSRPVAEICRAAHERRGGLRGLARRLDRAADRPEARPFRDALRADPVAAEILSGQRAPLSSVPSGCIRFIADDPGKAAGEGEAAERIAPAIGALLEGAASEALLISPYFVPGEAGAVVLERLARRGVRVVVVTNSLAATDVVAVHGGYARYRERLLRAGVELHELRQSGEHGASILGSRGASLHTKALVVDGAQAAVGSFNLDPRSWALNTEMGTFVADRAVAEGVRQEHRRLCAPARSWRLALDPAGGLLWTAGGAGEAWRREPEASASRRALAWLVRRLPLESQL